MPRAKKPNSIKAAEDCGWTDSRYMSFIRSTLRRSFTKFPTKHKVKNEASRPYKGLDKRRKKEYQCAVCSGWFPDKEVAVDHITPCGSLKTYEDLPKFVETLFCEAENLQVACKDCHQIKTNEERANR